jgi:DNA-binding LytR/AlgR family response regulator
LKIIIEEPRDNEDEQVIVRCRHITPEVSRLLNMLKSRERVLIGHIESEIHRVPASDIFYAETVDNKTFLYGARDVYASKQKLYELEEMLDASDFLRVSKSVIVNLSKIKSLVPALSGRLEAVLYNGEKVIISRQYVGALKKSLGI